MVKVLNRKGLSAFETSIRFRFDEAYSAAKSEVAAERIDDYPYVALDHFLKSKKLYLDNDCREEWLSLVENVRRDHYRKYSLIGNFGNWFREIILNLRNHLRKEQERDGKNRYLTKIEVFWHPINVGK